MSQRIFLLKQTDEPHEWAELLRAHCDELIVVSARAANDLVDQIYNIGHNDALIVASDFVDLTGLGMLAHRIRSQDPWMLVFYDDRPEWNLDQLRNWHSIRQTIIEYDSATAQDILQEFLANT